MKATAVIALLFAAAFTNGCSGNDDANVCDPKAQLAQPSADSNACAPLQTNQRICDLNGSGYTGSQYVWYDDQCAPRTAEMVSNTQRDPQHTWGGFMRRLTYVTQSAVRDCVGTDRNSPGFGWLVDHFSQGVADSRFNPGESSQTLFAGAHHAIHQYTWTYDVQGQPMHATVQWLFATGRAHPLWAVTFDMTGAPADAVKADTRSPYGAFAWDGNVQSDVGGVGWGDRNQFVSLDSPMSLQSGWDYTAANTVPYARTWSAEADAEMGSVQTQTMDQHDAGGYQFYTSRGQKSTQGPMPDITNWPYQIDQYELPNTQVKKLAWGTNFGAVGQTAYQSYGNDRTLSGYPYQSYSVHVVLGLHSTSTVMGAVADEENNQTATLSATNATVDTSGPAGIARPDSQTFGPAGYNPVYGTWDVHATGNPITLTLKSGGQALHRPMFVVHDFAAPGAPTVSLNGKALTADVDYYASVDTEGHKLWLTLATDVAASATLTVQ